MDQGPPQAWTRLGAAAELAARLHAGQVHKGTTIPYVSHLFAVATLVMEHGGDEDQACAALLHDAIEDCGAEHEATILHRFGLRVAAIVRACTDADVQPKPPWRARKEAYLAHLEHADQDALLVSAADKLHNARAIRGRPTHARGRGVHPVQGRPGGHALVLRCANRGVRTQDARHARRGTGPRGR